MYLKRISLLLTSGLFLAPLQSLASGRTHWSWFTRCCHPTRTFFEAEDATHTVLLFPGGHGRGK